MIRGLFDFIIPLDAFDIGPSMDDLLADPVTRESTIELIKGMRDGTDEPQFKAIYQGWLDNSGV